MPVLPNNVGEEPKSQSWPWPAAPGTRHACRNLIDRECPILLPAGQVLIVGSHSLPVDTHTSLPVDDAAALDQTLPPIDPADTECQVCSTWPECWSSSTTPPRMRGMS